MKIKDDEGFARIIQFSPSFDRRNYKPNYGQRAMIIYFVLKGDEGAIVFGIDSGWYVSGEGFSGKAYHNFSVHKVLDIEDAHSDCITENCGWLDGQACVPGLDSYTREKEIANRLFQGFIACGVGWLWDKLNEYYYHFFAFAAEPDLTFNLNEQWEIQNATPNSN